MISDRGIDIVQVIALVAAIGAAGVVLSKFYQATRKLFKFIDEVTGSPAAFGRKALPGLVEKVDQIQTTQVEMGGVQGEHTDQINRILHELYPNSGSSLRDAVDRLEASQATSTVVNINPAEAPREKP